MLFLAIFLPVVILVSITMKLTKDFWYKEGILDERDRILDAYMKSNNPIRETNKFLKKHLTDHHDKV
jgi:hypothetical protein